MRRLLFIYNFCNFGGVSSVLKQRSAELRREGIEPSFLFDRDTGGGAYMRAQFPERVAFGFEKLPEILAALDPAKDIVTVFDDPDVLMRVSGAFGGKVVFEIHSSLERSLSRLRPFHATSCSAMVVPSQWSKERVADYIGKGAAQNVLVVPNGVDRAVFGSDGPHFMFHKRVFIWVGKIATDKNYADAIRIFSRLKAQLGECAFLFVCGGNPAEPDVVTFLGMLNSHGIGDDTTFINNVESHELAAMLRGVRHSGGLLVSTSKHESFGLAVLEAMICGVPAVFTAVDALRQFRDLTGAVEIGDIDGAVDACTAIMATPQSYDAASQAAMDAASRALGAPDIYFRALDAGKSSKF